MMTSLYILLALVACAASAGGGVYATRRNAEKKRVIAEREDPRDTQIRDLLASMKIAKDDVARARASERDATEHLSLAHQRIEELLERINGVNQKFATCQESLTKEMSARELADDKYKAASQQLENLKQRTQELEMELNVSNAGDMLEPAGDAEPDDADEPIGSVFEEGAEDSSPSLIQCLTAEMERWKRHCHVLGEELKVQRDRLVNGDGDDDDVAAADPPVYEFDELTDIRGIGAVIARKLHQLGIYSFAQLAELSDDDHERAEMLIPDFARRMARDDWAGQARALQQTKA